MSKHFAPSIQKTAESREIPEATVSPSSFQNTRDLIWARADAPSNLVFNMGLGRDTPAQHEYFLYHNLVSTSDNDGQTAHS